MLPNRIIASILTALMLAPFIPTTQAQQANANGDLVVDRIDLGEGVVGRPTQLTIYVKNVGANDFAAPAGGWQLTVKYKLSTASAFDPGTCITGTDSDPNQACYARFTGPTDPMRAFEPGQTRQVVIPWTASRTDQSGLLTLVTRIEGSFCEQQAASGTCRERDSGFGYPSGPDDGGANNVKETRVFLKAPGVRALPVRSAPETPGKTVNSAWTVAEIKEECKLAPEITRVGCIGKPDTVLVFEYRVINTGNAADRYTARLLDADTSQNSILSQSRKWEIRYSENPVVIDTPGAPRDVRIEVVIPKSEWKDNSTNVGSTATAKFEWASTLDPTVTTNNVQPPPGPCDQSLQDQGLCTNPTFPSILIGTVRGVNVTTLDAFKQANVSQIVDFNITLNNTGNAFDTYSIKLRQETAQVNDSWTPQYPTFLSVPRSSIQNFTVTMKPPANASKGIHFFEMEIQSTLDTEGKTLRRVQFFPDLQQHYAISGSMDSPSLQVVPAKTAPFILRVKNHGNGHDNVTLTAPQNVPPGWSAVLSTNRVTVPGLETVVPVYLNVTAPENTPADRIAAIFVNATSQGPPDKLQDLRPNWSFKAETTIRAGPNIRITSPVTSAYIDPGGVHEFDLVVRNTGNERDNFTLTVDRDQSQFAWTASISPTFLVLDPTQQAPVRVTLRAPSTGIVGETTKAFVTVKSSSTTGTFEQVALEGRISGPDLFVSSVLANASTPYAGDPVEINVVLGNAGNKAPPRNATLKVYFLPQDGAARVIHDVSFAGSELLGGRRLGEQFIWDTTGVEGSGTLVARIDEGNEVAEIDESPASNEATRALTLRVFDIRLTPAQGLSGRPGERVAYTDAPHVFLAEYRGNQASEPVDIIIESEHGWGTSRIALALPRGSVIPILADVSIPTSPGVPRDTLRVSIVPSLRASSVVTATTVTTVLDDVPPRIRSLVAEPAQAKLGQPVTLRADITDATGLRSVRAFVTTPANETETFLLEKGAGDSWSHTQTWAAVGTYRVFVEAIDGSDAQNKNSSRDTVLTFLVQPGSAPRIQLAEGQSTTIRSGSRVQFNITDPLGVKSATYSVQGVSYDLPRPFALDTSSFTAGTHEVTVTAENIFGVASSERFVLVVDNTPPGIRSVTLDPVKPRANQDVVLRIETDPKVSAVDVLIKKDGQVVDTRPATKMGSGVFELLLNPGEGDYTLDVTAKDVAGNTKLQEGAAKFSAKPSSPFDVPGPAVWVAVASVAIGALLSRRRR